MLVDWSDEFDRWLDRLTAQADTGNERASRQLDLVTAELVALQELQAQPTEETPTFKRVRQSRQHLVWRVSHPYMAGIAVRLIIWFPPENPDRVVVALFAADKAAMGDVFYDSVGTRADAAINRYRNATQGEQSHD